MNCECSPVNDDVMSDAEEPPAKDPTAPLHGTEAATAAVRDAEKSRKPTCRFADRVGRCAVDAFEQLRIKVGLEYRQTVVAAIVVMRCVDGESELWVASVGAGTKFLRQAQIEADRAGGGDGAAAAEAERD